MTKTVHKAVLKSCTECLLIGAPILPDKSRRGLCVYRSRDIRVEAPAIELPIYLEVTGALTRRSVKRL